MEHVKGKVKIIALVGSMRMELTSSGTCRLGQPEKNRKILHEALEGCRCKGFLPLLIKVKTEISPKTGEEWFTPEVQSWFNRLPGMPHFLAYQNDAGEKAFWIDHEDCNEERPGIYWNRQEAWDAKQRLAAERPMGKWMVIPAEHRLEALKMLQLGLYQRSPGEGKYPSEAALHPAAIINDKYRDLQDALGLLPIGALTDPYMGEKPPNLKEITL